MNAACRFLSGRVRSGKPRREYRLAQLPIQRRLGDSTHAQSIRTFENAAVQSLDHQNLPGAVARQYLDGCTSLAHEHEQATAAWFSPHPLAHQPAQSLVAIAQIYRLRRHVNLDPLSESSHTPQ